MALKSTRPMLPRPMMGFASLRPIFPAARLPSASLAGSKQFILPRRHLADKPAAKPAGKPSPPTAKGAPADSPSAPSAPKSEAPTARRTETYTPPNIPRDPTNPMHAPHPGVIAAGPDETPLHIEKIADAIARLNMIESVQLQLALQRRMGIGDDDIKLFMASFGNFAGGGGGFPGAGAPAGAAGGGAAAPAAGAAAPAAKPEEKKPEKTNFDVKLVKYDDGAKMKVIKEVRTITNLNIPDTKALVDKAPSIIKKGVPKDEADKIVATLKGVGATVELE